jgi:esterase/lipase
MQNELDKIKAPVLLIYSKSDPQVPITNVEKIKARLTTDKVEQLILEKSGHVITEDIENDIAFETIYHFIKENSKS